MGDVLDSIPDELARQMVNVSVVVEDKPEDGSGHLLGLYQGIPLPERVGYGNGAAMPDRITIYRLPICMISRTMDHLRAEVRTTVLHEVAHHFGMDDAELHRISRY